MLDLSCFMQDIWNNVRNILILQDKDLVFCVVWKTGLGHQCREGYVWICSIKARMTKVCLQSNYFTL